MVLPRRPSLQLLFVCLSSTATLSKGVWAAEGAHEAMSVLGLLEASDTPFWAQLSTRTHPNSTQISQETVDIFL